MALLNDFGGLLSQLGRPAERKHRLDIVIQEKAVYLLASNWPDRVASYALINDESWQSALAALLSSEQHRLKSIGAYSARVVFSADYYQIYQVERPELPREEWPLALPFLLKDLISERVTDIVVDAFPLSDEKKIQAYVFNKPLILELQAALSKLGVHLTRVLPEDEVWGYTQQERPNFMLLYRVLDGDYRIGAFVSAQNRFQRTIRDVKAPLTGELVSEQQLDNLALEVQRSADYLSSKLRDTPIHHLLVCCDQEDQQALIHALSERLSISVESLNVIDQVVSLSSKKKVVPESSQPDLTANVPLLSGQLLCHTLASVPEQGINLYRNEFQPKKSRLTLGSVVLLWVLFALLLFAVGRFSEKSSRHLQEVITRLESESILLDQQQLALTQQLAQHQPSATKLAALSDLVTDIEAKQATLGSVQRLEQHQRAGYTELVADLIALGSSEQVRILTVSVDGQSLSIRGIASQASAIPEWLEGVQAQRNLAGIRFDTLKIMRDQRAVSADTSVSFSMTGRSNSAPVSRRVGATEKGLVEVVDQMAIKQEAP